jgi:hypothetical protein
MIRTEKGESECVWVSEEGGADGGLRSWGYGEGVSGFALPYGM